MCKWDQYFVARSTVAVLVVAVVTLLTALLSDEWATHDDAAGDTQQISVWTGYDGAGADAAKALFIIAGILQVCLLLGRCGAMQGDPAKFNVPAPCPTSMLGAFLQAVLATVAVCLVGGHIGSTSGSEPSWGLPFGVVAAVTSWVGFVLCIAAHYVTDDSSGSCSSTEGHAPATRRGSKAPEQGAPYA
eukprot:TRINITY_DN19883_c0_g1_i1.p1 TRINITY_DN19883_c0_g1~~TRINITY_DN19883_c0_g1_i1.p1  ORF type:complete len:188 (+),score=67.10 TRINITY_DN19883_c0_g1_i1:87-650(+)